MDNSKAATISSNRFSKAFWITIFSFAGFTILLLVAGLLRTPTQEMPYEVQSELLIAARTQASQLVVDQMGPRVNLLVDSLYAPVYEGIPIYADFHYTVLGEYTELVGAVLSNSSSKIEEMMFNGFNERLDGISAEIDTLFHTLFKENMDILIQQSLPNGVQIEELGPISSTIIGDLKNRALVTVPLASVASVGGVALVKVTSQKIASQIAAKILLKTATKATAKGVGMLAGIGIGAMYGSALGPVGSVVGGVVGGAVTWFVVDKVIIELSEIYFREDFETDLRKSIDLNKEDFRSAVFATIENKKKEVESFTIGDL